MREKILALLKEKSPSFVSGAEMAGRLSVSRTAVWKNVNLLQADGYRIERSPRLGYRLQEVPDLLYPLEFAGDLETKIIAAERRLIHYHRQVDSTAEVIKKLAEKGAPEGTIVLAEEQTGGRGRMGRSWYSPFAGGIWLHILLRPPLTPAQTPLLTLLASVAVTKAIRRLLPHVEAGIKWPNDVLVRGRKVCGILTELKAEPDIIHYVITGIGINVNIDAGKFRTELKDTATSLYLENKNNRVSRQKLTAFVLEEMDTFYRQYLSAGSLPVIEEWKKYSITLGEEVTIKNVLDVFWGKAVDVDSSGALVVEGKNGLRRHFQAGEVTLRGTGR